MYRTIWLGSLVPVRTTTQDTWFGFTASFSVGAERKGNQQNMYLFAQKRFSRTIGRSGPARNGGARSQSRYRRASAPAELLPKQHPQNYEQNQQQQEQPQQEQDGQHVQQAQQQKQQVGTQTGLR